VVLLTASLLPTIMLKRLTIDHVCHADQTKSVMTETNTKLISRTCSRCTPPLSLSWGI